MSKKLNAKSGVNTSRRQFIIGAASTGAGLTVGFSLPSQVLAQSAVPLKTADEVNVWVVIQPDEKVVIRIARSEMGQATRTGLAQLVAEELECDWNKVTTQDPTPGENLARGRAWGAMATGGSRGIRDSQDYVRRGGAAARLMLLQAAADQWKVPVNEVTVSKGVIKHVGSGRQTTYGKMADAAARLTPPDPKSIVLKKPSQWTIAGTSVPRLDTAEKVNGAKVYSIDLRLPGMLCAAVKSCPVFGGKLLGFDESKVKSMRGVKSVIKVNDSTVAVVADTWWRAKTALENLPIDWDLGPNAKASSSTIGAQLREGLQAEGTFAQRNIGDARVAIKNAHKKVEAVYVTPFVAHATMEPMNCVVQIGLDRARAWVPTQNGEASLAALSEASGLKLNQCDIQKMDLGGGLGRRGGTQDFMHQAVAIAKHFPDVPIKLVWSREEDMTHDFYRPTSVAKMSAGLDEKGKLVAFHGRISGQSINAWLSPAAIKNNLDVRQLQGWYAEPGDAQLGYTVPNLLTEYVMRNTHVPVGPWRGVNTNQNGIYMECFIEECARAAGRDSLEFRRELMQEHPKHLAVLNAVAEKGDWGKPLPPGVHRGIAQFMGYGSYSAATAEVSVSPSGQVKVHRMVFALNSGHHVNPSQVKAQIEGSVVMALSATFNEEITIENGAVKETNYHLYPLAKLKDTPKVECVLVPTHDFWGGVGEPTICVVGPAVLNAIFAATGKPQRELPLRKHGLTLA